MMKLIISPIFFQNIFSFKYVCTPFVLSTNKMNDSGDFLWQLLCIEKFNRLKQ